MPAGYPQSGCDRITPTRFGAGFVAPDLIRGDLMLTA
ncbi:hypothetical protein MKAN_21365 [Mycobacterium kansasii ATCC 12478]|uniref:Uncharacterized protein n=1 Tax=Mycobacterium kansasii ATCC 12478 TaxID=557599 RepID=U5WZ01_MYCKA|nr:hypothetical protein MKAN_21365 [Mycobacterium kansasii ATCC 12478]